MRKTPKDFYNLYLEEYKPFIFERVFHLNDYDADFDDFEELFNSFAWVVFMHSFVETCSQTLPERISRSATISNVLSGCDDETSEVLFDAMRINRCAGDGEGLLSCWLREMISLRFELDDSQLDYFFKRLVEYRKEKMNDEKVSD